MQTKCLPDLSKRTLTMTCERDMRAPAHALYEAWTENFDAWFAAPGECLMTAEIDRPFFFYNRHDWGRHAHYGRFLQLEKDRLVEMTWVTGPPGTDGVETVMRIELTPRDNGTHLRLTQSGFGTEQSRDGHLENWPGALDVLDEALKSSWVAVPS